MLWYNQDTMNMQNLLLEPLFDLSDKSFTVFGLEIRYYALIIVCGMVLAAVLSGILMRRRNISHEWVLTLFIVCIPCAIIGARLYWCITSGASFSQWWKIHDGGLSILGGVTGGVLGGLVVCLIKKADFFRLADCIIVNIPLAQAIGRWGNYVNEEVYGPVVTNPQWQFFPFAVEIDGKWHMAFFFYESVLNLIVFAVLFTLAWRFYKKPSGLLACLYAVCYGTIRTVMEPLRDPEFILNNGDIMWSWVTSIVLIVLGLVGIAVLLILNYRKEGSLIGSKRGDPYAIREFIPCYKEDRPNYSGISAIRELREKECSETEGDKSKN